MTGVQTCALPIYLYEHILFPLLYYKKDKIFINDSEIENYKNFRQYILLNDLDKNEIVEIISEYLSKHLDKFYYNLISSKFMYYYQKGWMGV